MVVVWGNILSLLGNVFAIAVDILVFDAFSLATIIEKSVGHIFYYFA